MGLEPYGRSPKAVLSSSDPLYRDWEVGALEDPLLNFFQGVLTRIFNVKVLWILLSSAFILFVPLLVLPKLAGTTSSLVSFAFLLLMLLLLFSATIYELSDLFNVGAVTFDLLKSHGRP